jgi:hypothetical protein
MKRYLYSLLLLPLLSYSDNFYNSTNLQGYTGVINTPTAEILENSKAELSYSNQLDSPRFYGKDDKFTSDQYFLNLGIFPNFEFGGRLSVVDLKVPQWGIKTNQQNDLSASFKYQIPYYHKYFPKIAFGIQDLGGEANNYDSKYIVATKEYGFVRGSLGYSFDSMLMDGFFGSVELKATDWAYILSEYDSKDFQVALRLNTPKKLFGKFQASVLAKQNLSNSDQEFSYSLNLKVPLGDEHHLKRDISMNTTVINPTILPDQIDTLKERLIQIGFENIDISNSASTIQIAYENNIFDHNELDAFGVILGNIVNLPYDKFELITKRSNQKIKKLSGSLNEYRTFLTNPSVLNENVFKNTLSLTTPSSSDDMILRVENANSSYLKPRLELSFGISTFVGTEYGVFDYELMLKPYLHTTLYKGFELGILGNIPLYNTDNVDKDRGVFRQYYKDQGIDSILLHRNDTFGNFINILSVGQYKEQWAGFENLTFAKDNHTLGIKLGYIDKDDDKNEDSKKIYLANYSYYNDRYDTLLEVAGGQYYYEDTGYNITLKRFFGDTAINLIYQNTNQQYAGIGIEIPLTPRKAPDLGYMQVKGTNNFKYRLRSAILDENHRNYIGPNDALPVSRVYDIEDRFLNRNRLNIDYIKKHLSRFRDAHNEFVSFETPTTPTIVDDKEPYIQPAVIEQDSIDESITEIKEQPIEIKTIIKEIPQVQTVESSYQGDRELDERMCSPVMPCD